MKKAKKINIFNYSNYRRFLADYYQERKGNGSFSYRAFAQKAGFNSSGFYKDIVNERTNITPNMIAKLARAIGLSKREEEYFENMVLFNQAPGSEEKSKYFGRMMRFYNSKAYLVDAKQYEFYSKWYYSAVRDLLATGDFSDDYGTIARSLNPAIRKDQAQKAIRLLEKLGLIKKDEKGFYRATEKVITTGDEVKSLNVANFQKQMMDLAREAIDRHPAGRRNISTVTFSVSETTYKEIEAELVSFRKRVLGMAERDLNVDRVYQLNLQLFPLTKIKDNEK